MSLILSSWVTPRPPLIMSSDFPMVCSSITIVANPYVLGFPWEIFSLLSHESVSYGTWNFFGVVSAVATTSITIAITSGLPHLFILYIHHHSNWVSWLSSVSLACLHSLFQCANTCTISALYLHFYIMFNLLLFKLQEFSLFIYFICFVTLISSRRILPLQSPYVLLKVLERKCHVLLWHLLFCNCFFILYQ